MAVHLDACIQCKRCVRACREEQVNDVIGYAFRGGHSKIVFDLDDPMGDSTCVACGECVQACPTGALMPARDVAKIVPEKTVDSVCPVLRRRLSAHLQHQGQQDSLRAGQGRPGELEPPVREGPLRLRLRPASPSPDQAADSQEGRAEAQGLHRRSREVARGVPRGDVGGSARLRGDTACATSATPTARSALAGFGSAKGTNEEAYLFQKLVRTGFGSNNVDHCTRLCHASSVAALMEGINSGAVSNQVRDVANAEVIFLIGANPTVNHPVAATWIKNAAKAGAKLIVADPRRGDLARHATYYLQFNADTDVALLNAMLHVIVEEGLVGPVLHPRSHVGIRRARREREEVLARGDGADLRHRRADDPRGRAALRHVEGLDHPVGHGDLAARARHRQRALPDRAGAVHRPDRQARLGAASAARSEQRAGRIGFGSDPDVLSRLSAREHAGGARALREAVEDRARSQSGPRPSSRS